MIKQTIPSLLASTISEADRRALIIGVVILFLLFLLAALIGWAVRATSRFQAQGAHELVLPYLNHGIIRDGNHFRSLGYRKNNRLFFHQSWIPVLIMFTSLIVWVVGSAIRKSWSANIFGEFGDLFFQWDFAHAKKAVVFGRTVLADWPARKAGYPRWVGAHTSSYLAVFLLLVGGIGFLVAAQAYFSRFVEIISLSHRDDVIALYTMKPLTPKKPEDPFAAQQQAPQQQAQQPSPQQNPYSNNSYPNSNPPGQYPGGGQNTPR